MKNTFLLFTFLLSFHFFYAQKTINASAILDKIKNGASIEIENTTINGVLDLTYMQDKIGSLPKRNSWWNNGGSNTVEYLITNKISFINCIFNNNVLAYIPDENSGYTFITHFKDTVIFKNCKFKQKAMFKYSNFYQGVNFYGTKFMDDSSFKYSQFSKNTNFEKTIFDESVTFKYAVFKKQVSFKNAIFEESAVFKYAKFNHDVSFNSTNFNEDLDIKYVNISGKFDITNMKVAFSIDAKYANINGKKFKK